MILSDENINEIIAYIAYILLLCYIRDRSVRTKYSTVFEILGRFTTFSKELFVFLGKEEPLE